MGGWLSRETELINLTGEVLQIRECPAGDSDGECVVPIQLQPNEHKQIRATRFHRHSVDSGRRRDIKVGMDHHHDHEVIILAAHEFIFFGRFIFTMDDNRRLVVNKVRVPGSDLCRIKLVACFGRLEIFKRPSAGN